MKKTLLLSTLLVTASSITAIAQQQNSQTAKSLASPSVSGAVDCSTVLKRQRNPQECAAQDEAKRRPGTSASIQGAAQVINTPLQGRGVPTTGPVSASNVPTDRTYIGRQDNR